MSIALYQAEFSPDMSDDVASDVSETSDMSEVSKVSTISVRSTQSERPRRKLRYEQNISFSETIIYFILKLATDLNILFFFSISNTECQLLVFISFI